MKKLIVFSNLSSVVSAISPSLLLRYSANSRNPSYGAVYTLEKLLSFTPSSSSRRPADSLFEGSVPLEVPEIWTAPEVDPSFAPPEQEVSKEPPPPHPDAPEMPNPPTPPPPPPDVPFPRPPQVQPPFPKPGPPNPHLVSDCAGAASGLDRVILQMIINLFL